jgi:SprT-like domain-contaning protein Spartan
MNEINSKEGTNISIYHEFYEEVEKYRKHWFQCQGICKRIVKQSVNRGPNRYDVWWEEHLKECGGNFEKIKNEKEEEKNNLKGYFLKKIKNDKMEMENNLENDKKRKIHEIIDFDEKNKIKKNIETKKTKEFIFPIKEKNEIVKEINTKHSKNDLNVNTHIFKNVKVKLN